MSVDEKWLLGVGVANVLWGSWIHNPVAIGVGLACIVAMVVWFRL